MFYGQCWKCGERWGLGTASTCKCPDKEPVKMNDGRLTRYPDGSIGIGTPSVPASDTSEEHVDETAKQRHEQEAVACDGDFPEGFDASLGIPAQALRTANAIMFDVIGKREWDVPCTAQHVLSFAKKYTTPPSNSLNSIKSSNMLDAQRKPLTDEEIPEGVLLAIRRAGLTLVMTAQGYHLMNLGPIEAAHGIKGEA